MSSGESDTRRDILSATWQLMMQRNGQNVRMSDVATAAGVSRQTVYLHFGSRTQLLVATTHYVDEVCGLNERLPPFQAVIQGVQLLDLYVEFWGNYIPEIYGLAKALLAVRDVDEAAAAAWNDRMSAVRTGCRCVVEGLQRDGMLSPVWQADKAIDLLWSILSIRNWEHLTIECGWSTSEYVRTMQMVLKCSLVRDWSSGMYVE